MRSPSVVGTVVPTPEEGQIGPIIAGAPVPVVSTSTAASRSPAVSGHQAGMPPPGPSVEHRVTETRSLVIGLP